MTFLHPQLLWFLALPALLLTGELLRRRRHRRRAAATTPAKILTALAGPRTLRLSPSPAPSLSPRAAALRWRLALGLASAVLALARPQWGRIEEPVFEQAREILIAVDLSRSMLAADIKPTRLERARLLIQSLLGQLAGERVGLLVFSGTAFLQSPLSSDYEILREFLPELGPDYLPQGGTHYGALLQSALDSFSRENNADRFLVILSDGEADPEATPPWQPLADTARERGVHIIGLGLGTAEGAMIPDEHGSFVKDERGAVVLSRLESATLRELADKTAGAYADASQWVDLSALIKSTVARGQKGEFHESSRSRLIERFQWALGPALVLLLWSLWREFPVHPRPRRITLASTTAAAFALVLFSLPAPDVRAQQPEAGDREPVAGSRKAGDKTLITNHPVTPPPPPSPAKPDSGLLPLTSGLSADDEHAPSATVDSTKTSADLSRLVTRLADQPSLSAKDAAALAETTLAWGQPLHARNKPVPGGPVDDALEAVRHAEKTDPRAADWQKLRTALEELKQKQQPPPQNQQQQQGDKQNQDKNNQQQSQKNPSGADGQQGDKNEDSDKQDQPSSGQPGQSGDSPKSGSPDASSDKQPDPGNPSPPSASPDQQPSPPSGDTADDQGKGKDNDKPRAGQSAFGDKNDNGKDKPEEKSPAQEPASARPDEPPPEPASGQATQPSPADDKNTQRVGGVSTAGSALDKNTDPNLLVPLQRLERLKDADSPAELFNLMQDPQPQPAKPGRNW
ncbi:MAG: VWA domain-containing protein [Opitutaceae bacterium]|jgi:Ca-activated chloride channel family protein|nr:VWA domain-containing protein [Opitutaceae bacterium]